MFRKCQGTHTNTRARANTSHAISEKTTHLSLNSWLQFQIELVQVHLLFPIYSNYYHYALEWFHDAFGGDATVCACVRAGEKCFKSSTKNTLRRSCSRYSVLARIHSFKSRQIEIDLQLRRNFSFNIEFLFRLESRERQSYDNILSKNRINSIYYCNCVSSHSLMHIVKSF